MKLFLFATLAPAIYVTQMRRSLAVLFFAAFLANSDRGHPTCYERLAIRFPNDHDVPGVVGEFYEVTDNYGHTRVLQFLGTRHEVISGYRKTKIELMQTHGGVDIQVSAFDFSDSLGRRWLLPLDQRVSSLRVVARPDGWIEVPNVSPRTIGEIIAPLQPRIEQKMRLVPVSGPEIYVRYVQFDDPTQSYIFEKRGARRDGTRDMITVRVDSREYLEIVPLDGG